MMTDMFSAKYDITIGLVILVLDAILLIVVVDVFFLIEMRPAWENLFAFATIALIPAYALFRIGRGVYKKFISWAKNDKSTHV